MPVIFMNYKHRFDELMLTLNSICCKHILDVLFTFLCLLITNILLVPNSRGDTLFSILWTSRNQLVQL